MEKELFISAARAVLEKYGDDNSLVQLLSKGRENKVFDQFCVRIVDCFRPLTAQTRVKAMSTLHSLCLDVVPGLQIHRTTHSSGADPYNTKCKSSPFQYGSCRRQD